PGVSRATAASWPIVRVLGVSWLPSIFPALNNRWATSLVPPARSRSAATNRPPGLRSARIGVRLLTVSKSSMVNGTSASRALAAAGASAGAGVVLQVLEISVGHLAAGVRPDRLEDVLNRNVAALELAGRDRAAIEHEAGHIYADQAHCSARDCLVAGDQDDN